MHSKAYRIYNKHTKTIEESIHVIFDESNDGVVSGSTVQDLHLNKYGDDEEEAAEETNSANKLPQEQQEESSPQEEEEPTNEENSPPNMPQHVVTQKHFKYKSFHPMDNLSTNISTSIRTHSSLHNFCAFFAFVPHIEPRNYLEALNDSNWINAMQEELNQFERNQVLTLTTRPKDHPIIGIKWVFRNKLDETETVIRNKARLVAKGRRHRFC